MYNKKDYSKITVQITYDDLKLIIDGLYTLRRKTNPRSTKAFAIWDLIDQLKSVLDKNNKY